MTAILARPEPAKAVEPAPRPARPAAPPRRPAPVLRAISIGFSLALLLVLGFLCYLYGFSTLSEQRAQANIHKSFQKSLGEAVAPVGPAPEGAPVAVLDIPDLGLRSTVVVEGTSARDLTRGPGHRADTVLPGQAGVSVIYGRRATFGYPFAHLMRLHVGSVITVTTGQGTARYTVSSFGDGSHPAPANSANRLVLTTADSATSPHSTVSVSADLQTPVQATPAGLPAIGPNQRGMTGDLSGSLPPLMLWSQLLLVLSVAASFAIHRWSRTATYLCLAPALLAVLWSIFENVACLLPNLY